MIRRAITTVLLLSWSACPVLAAGAPPPNASMIEPDAAAPAARPASPAPAAPAPPPAGPADMAAVTAAAPPNGQVVYGSPDAPVTVVEYASLSCPHCGAFAREVWPSIKRDYVDTGKVRWIYRDFPLSDPFSVVESMFLACTAPEARPALIDDVFAAQQEIAKSSAPAPMLMTLMSRHGMGLADLDACLEDKKRFAGLQSDREQAIGRLGVTGTPTFFVAGQRWTGGRPYADFKAVLDQRVEPSR